MANCNDLFQKFYKEIDLPKSKEKSLITARDAIRDKIREYFKNAIKEKIPKFYCQGSYAMSTIINPLDGEYDIDDGVYLQNLSLDMSKWSTVETVHNWIYKAVEGHTKEDPIDKKTCVRVIYSGEYHVDLPIYGIYNNSPYLAENGEGWHISDPKSITDWFLKEVKNKDEQLRKIVRYFKAWSDNKKGTAKFPSNLILTVLIVGNYENKERDDASFGRTVRNIYLNIVDSFVVYNPVDQNEILTERLTETQKKTFKDLLVTLLDSANKALEERNKKQACKIWKKEFGNRFPCCDDIKEEEFLLYTSSPAILRDDARSA